MSSLHENPENRFSARIENSATSRLSNI